MRHLHKPVVALALGALLIAGTAQAAVEPCMTNAELDQLLLFSLADVVDGAAGACRPSLAADAFLVSDGPALVQRYRAAQPGAWPMARKAMMKMPGVGGDEGKGNAMMATLPDDALKPFVSGMVRQMVTTSVKPKDCARVDQVVRLLAPLPAENMAGLFTLIIGMVDHPTPDRKARLPLCPAAPAPAASH